MAGRETEIAGLAGGAHTTASAAGAADPPLPAGAVIDGRYRVIAEIGAGGMGRVYAAEHMFIRRRMALKLLRRGLAGATATDTGAAARLVQEATLAGQVPHPAVVRVFDCAVLGDGQVYLAMELLRGESLEQALRRPGHAAEIVPLLAEVARGLAAVHRIGVVHRDIKPGNIFLARGDAGVQAKLLDFGVAKLLPGAAGDDANAVQTQAGAVLGTPYYLAPEQARGAAIDGRADLYSLGVILYEVLTGGLPFVGDSFMAILAQHVRTPPLDPRQAAPARAIPDGVARLTMRLLAKDPDERLPDGDVLADEIEALMRSEGEALARVPTGSVVASAEVGTQRLADGGLVDAGTQQLGEHGGDGAGTRPPGGVAEAGTQVLAGAQQAGVAEAGTQVLVGTQHAGVAEASTQVLVGTQQAGLAEAGTQVLAGGVNAASGPGGGSRADMAQETGSRGMSFGTGSVGDMSAGTAGLSVRTAEGPGRDGSAAGSRGSLFVGAAAVAIASAVIGWTVVRAANTAGPASEPSVVAPAAGSAPAVTRPAETAPVAVPPAPVVERPVGPAGLDVAPTPAAATPATAGDAARAGSAGATARPGKKRPRDGGTTRTPAAKKTAEPQLKPDVYDE